MKRKAMFTSLLAALAVVSGIGANTSSAAPNTPSVGLIASINRFAEFPVGTPSSKLPIGVAWGQNASFQVGDGTTTDRLTATQITAGSVLTGKEVSAISVGELHSCAIANGKAYCWGEGSDGQLGNNAATDSSKPVLVGGLLSGKIVTAISVGSHHTCAVANARAYCWGWNPGGQFGTGNHNASKAPVAVSTSGALNGRAVSSIATSGYFTCAIADGEPFCWGEGRNGVLGTGNVTDSFVPVKVSKPAGLAGLAVDSIAVGWHHGCLTAAGKVWCWGVYKNVDNWTPGTFVTKPELVATGGLVGATVTALSADRFTTCVIAIKGRAAITTDGKAYCWGAGNLGNGGASASTTPVAVTTSGVLAERDAHTISVGSAGACLTADSKGYCWGGGADGRLGNNSTQSSTNPVAVSVVGPLVGRNFAQISTKFTTSGIAFSVNAFSDIAASNALYDEIRWSVGTGIIKAFGDGTFRPNNSVLRKEFAAYLYRYAHPGVPLPTACDGDVFADVNGTEPLCGAIEWMAAAELYQPGQNFSPNQALRRDDAATYLSRYQHLGGSDEDCLGTERIFDDVPVQNHDCGNVEWLAKIGLTNSAGNYQPSNPVTRGRLAQLLFDLDALNVR